MSRMTIQTDLGRIEDLPTLIKYTALCIQQLNNIVNGNIEFDTNIASQTVSYTFTSTSTFVLIKHGLNRKNLKFMLVDSDQAGVLWHNAVQDDVSHIALAFSASVVSNVKILLF
jgi:hypothetical protein